MLYCPDHYCTHRQNDHSLSFCKTCGSSLVINSRYQLLKPLRELDRRISSIFYAHDFTDSRCPHRVIKLIPEIGDSVPIRIAREISILGRFNEDSIVKIHDSFELQSMTYGITIHGLVFEWLPGEDLETWVEHNGKTKQSQVILCAKRLVQALRLVHKERFIHRDIKPNNVMLCGDRLVLIDFGTVRDITPTYQDKMLGEGVTGIYSPGYTPQEQINCKPELRSDFFALGRTIIYLVTGIPPEEFPWKQDPELWKNSARHVSPNLIELIDRLIAPHVDDRPASCDEILQSLASIQGKRWRWLWGGSVGAVVIVSIGIDTFANYTKAGSLLEQGQQALQLRQYVEAEDIFRRFLASDATNADAHYSVSLACHFQQKLDCATAYLRQAIELGKDDVFVHYELALNLDKMGYLESAIEEYKIALNKASVQDVPSLTIFIYNNLSRLLNLTRQYQQAKTFAEDGIQLALNNPRNDELYVKTLATLHKNFSWSLLYLGDYEQALISLNTSIELNSNVPSPHCLLAKLLEQINQNPMQSWQNCLNFEDENDLIEVQRWKEDAQLEMDQLSYE